MKKTILLSTIASVTLFATNGDIMIGDGAKATGMGGVGIAVSHGAESLYANPAMIKDIKGSEFTGYVTIFQPDVTFKSDASPQLTSTMTTTSQSEADRSFIPGFAYVHRNNENIVWGISFAGTAGMGTDYKNAAQNSGAFGMQTALGIAKLSIPVAYTKDDLTVAVAPVLQYSTLEINYQTPAGASNNQQDASVGLGMTAGVAYELGDLTLAGLYKSKIEANYKGNISNAMRDFNVRSVTSGDQLDQPAEIGVGAAYKMGNSTFAVDLTKIQWSDVAGYKDFNWEDQNVIKLGYRYTTPTWVLRAGYNYGKSPIQELDATQSYDNGAVNFFNLVGFPAIVEQHYTIGGDYAFSKALTLSLAAVYTPEVTNSFNTTAMTYGMAYGGALQQGATELQAQQGAAQAAANGSTADVRHSQSAITLGVTYRF